MPSRLKPALKDACLHQNQEVHSLFFQHQDAAPFAYHRIISVARFQKSSCLQAAYNQQYLIQVRPPYKA